jgi:hypothetical protein
MIVRHAHRDAAAHSPQEDQLTFVKLTPMPMRRA